MANKDCRSPRFAIGTSWCGQSRWMRAASRCNRRGAHWRGRRRRWPL